jgi:hypothetical protein
MTKLLIARRTKMKKPCALFVYPAALILSLGLLACASSSYQRIDVNDVPKTPFELTLYRTATKGVAVILDEPSDNVHITFVREAFRAKPQGLKTAEEYMKEFLGTPKVYRLQDKQEGTLFGYLLISPELQWVVQHEKNKGKVNIYIIDPHDVTAK